MKTTQELLGLDPTVFKDMSYSDVLYLKLEAAQAEYDDLAKQHRDLGILPGTYDKASAINQQMIKYKKAIQYITLWIEEMGERI